MPKAEVAASFIFFAVAVIVEGDEEAQFCLNESQVPSVSRLLSSFKDLSATEQPTGCAV